MRTRSQFRDDVQIPDSERAGIISFRCVSWGGLSIEMKEGKHAYQY